MYILLKKTNNNKTVLYGKTIHNFEAHEDKLVTYFHNICIAYAHGEYIGIFEAGFQIYPIKDDNRYIQPIDLDLEGRMALYQKETGDSGPMYMKSGTVHYKKRFQTWELERFGDTKIPNGKEDENALQDGTK